MLQRENIWYAFLDEQIHCFTEHHTYLTLAQTIGSHACRLEPAVCALSLYSTLDTACDGDIHRARAPPCLLLTDPARLLSCFPAHRIDFHARARENVRKEAYR